MTPDELTDERSGAAILSAEENWERLNSTRLGRLAVSVGGQPDIFPINYTVINNALYLRTVEGSKLAAIAVHNAVAFEIDGLDEKTNVAWSVVVRGEACILTHQHVIDELEALPWFSWNRAPKNQFVEITPIRISGRALIAHSRTKD